VKSEELRVEGVGCRLQVAGYRLKVIGYGLLVVGMRGKAKRNAKLGTRNL
jgi:hypothetical protein